jgi:hypothetical protein
MLRQESYQEYDFDSLMHKLMLMRAIDRPCITDIMVAPIGAIWEGTKPNGHTWQITKTANNICKLSN